MNPYKLRRTVELIYAEGALIDYLGQPVDLDEVMRCYGLDEMLTKHEQILVQRELAEMREADLFIERVKLARQQIEWLSEKSRPG